MPVVEDSSSDRDIEIELGKRHWFLIAIYIAAILAASVTLHVRLPNPDVANTNYSQFSELRAKRNVFEMSNFGPKPAGSEACDGLTKRYILNEIDVIKVAATAKLEVSQQNPSGCLDIPRFDTDGFTVCYKNISNVVVRLSRPDAAEDSKVAVLLNCHFDSWPTSSGGSDDLLSCALMLEVMRLLSRNPQVLSHDVIFLFNGAEESSLQGAHGFITKHPWRHAVRAFINLEASGSGGRELLFQAGPSNQWLLNSYLEAAVHPHCSIIGQEIFQSGFFPGDTDFRVFRDYGRVPGLDLAFVQNGYWWHTEFDEARRITVGSLQRAGENVHATLVHLLQSPYLDNPAEYGDQKYVFFDFLGLFVVVYPITIGNAVNAILVMAVLLKVVHQLRNSSGHYKAAVSSYVIVFAAMTAVTLTVTQMTLAICGAMPWYTVHGIAVLIYGLPSAWTGISTMAFLAAKFDPPKREDHGKAVENVHRAMVAVNLAFLTFKGVASGFLFAFMLLPILKDILPFKNEWVVVSSHLLLHTPSYAMSMYLSSMFLSTFIPIMGRTGSNPELVIAVLVNFAVFSIVLSLLPLVSFTEIKRTKEEASIPNFLLMIGGILLVAAAVLGVVSVVQKSPYSHTDAYPVARRVQLFHVNRALYNKDGGVKAKDAGMYVIAQDYRGAEDIPFVDGNYSHLQCVYEGSPYCEIPLYFPTRSRIQERHIRYRLLDEAPQLPETKITMMHKTESPNKLVYDFQVSGSNQLSVFIIPQNGWRLANCSMSAPRKELDERPLFLFLTCSGNQCGEWTFKLAVGHPGSPNPDDEGQVLVGVASHYLFGNYMHSGYIKRILADIVKNRDADPAWSIAASAWNVDLVYRFF